MTAIKNSSFETLSSKEWLVTNGIGGFASGTVSGANSRRYHALLCASFNPPTDRKVIISKFEETVISDTGNFHLSSNEYPLAVYPDGFQHIISFERQPFPKWNFEANGIAVAKTIFMIYGRNTTVVEYQNLSKQEITIEINQFVVCRDYHQLRGQSKDFFITIKNTTRDKIECIPSDGSSPFYIFSNGIFEEKPEWYNNFQLAVEKERGLDAEEDAFCPGKLILKLKAQEKNYVTISTDGFLPDGSPQSWKKHEELRLQSLSEPYANTFLHDLQISGDQFIVWRLSSKSHTIIAGYPWFTDWGRDTMIAMRGLIIAAGKKQLAESIIMTFLRHVKNGLIPNRFPDNGIEPEYNTIDATLWMFVVLHDYYQKFNDEKFIEKVFPILSKIIEAHINGTDYNIHVTPEGLLYGGSDDVQLTWMDAKVGDYVVTSRKGCAVEVNALWYNALHVYCSFGDLLSHEVSFYKQQLILTAQSFQTYFVNDQGYLNDVVIPDVMTDASIRPNQIYAISLPYSPITAAQSERVLSIVEEHLYTDYGLRSLSPTDQEFRPIFTGDQWQRDNAYHQGTVWSHLWGEYALAYLRINDYSKNAKEIIKQKSIALREHFYNHNCLYAISENFDGGNPKEGKGCMQQAWSIGMTILALLATED